MRKKPAWEIEVAEEKDLLPKLERVLVGIHGGDNGRLASRLAGWLIGARHLTATAVMDAGSAANRGSGTTPSVSRGVIEAAETAAHAVEAKKKPRATETKNRRAIALMRQRKEQKRKEFPLRS